MEGKIPNEIYNFRKILKKTCLTFGVNDTKQIRIYIENKEQDKEKYYFIGSNQNGISIIRLTDSFEGILRIPEQNNYYLEKKLSYLGKVSVLIGNEEKNFPDFPSFLDFIKER